MYKYKSFFKIYDHHMLKIRGQGSWNKREIFIFREHSLEELSLIAQYHGKNFSKSNARNEKKIERMSQPRIS